LIFFLFTLLDGVYLVLTKFINKRNHIQATLDFLKYNPYKNLTSKTKHNGYKIGAFRDEQRRRFKKASEVEQLELIKEYSSVDQYYLYDTAYKNHMENYRLSKEFINLYGIENLTNLTGYKGYKIEPFRCRQKMKYKNLDTDNEKRTMKKEFDNIHPDYLLDAVVVSKRQHIQAILEFIEKFGYDKLTNKTEYNGYKIGSFRSRYREITF